MERWLTEDMGWTSLGMIPSPISGGDGNEEFLLAGQKPLGDGNDDTDDDIGDDDIGDDTGDEADDSMGEDAE
ncbi:hypothetical protein PDO_4382 [Rhizobium sp. PDO1-076]|nr:hypothetical protein PDO_4382 [Rhizobium sp. PDO1-076]